MILNEFFYFDKKNNLSVDRRYDSQRDSSRLRSDDKRKLRLTLRQINQLRQQSEAHEFEKESEREFIRQMYGIPAPEPGQ